MSTGAEQAAVEEHAERRALDPFYATGNSQDSRD